MRPSREPVPELADAAVAACLQRRVLVAKAGWRGHVLRFLPPLVMNG